MNCIPVLIPWRQVKAFRSLYHRPLAAASSHPLGRIDAWPIGSWLPCIVELELDGRSFSGVAADLPCAAVRDVNFSMKPVLTAAEADLLFEAAMVLMLLLSTHDPFFFMMTICYA
jgi:hypothetical protein